MTLTLHPPRIDPRRRATGPGRSEPEGGDPVRQHSTRATAAGVLVTVRPYQWAKNAAVLMVPGLLILSIGVGGAAAAIVATLAFCLAASSVYLLNDVADRDHDRHHPTKRHRPIASGAVSVPVALAVAAAAASLAVGLALLIAPVLAVIVVAYLVLTAAYSLLLKRYAYLDVAILAAGFVLRVLAGAVAVGVSAPPLLLGAVFSGAVFISFGKRRSEAVLLGADAAAHRSALRTYTVPMLDKALVDTEMATVILFGAWVVTSMPGPAGVVLGLMAAVSLHLALNAYRGVLRGGAGGDPVHDLVRVPVLASLAVCGLIALSTGLIH